jgi:hypothetical protein
VTTYVKDKLRAYFKAHPDAELTYPEAVKMFNVVTNTLNIAVMELEFRGELEYVRIIRRKRHKRPVRVTNVTGHLPGNR